MTVSAYRSDDDPFVQKIKALKDYESADELFDARFVVRQLEDEVIFWKRRIDLIEEDGDMWGNIEFARFQLEQAEARLEALDDRYGYELEKLE